MLLAIDQGGSKTAAAILREDGAILGVGYSFGACHFVVGIPRAMEAVRLAAQEACAQAGIAMADINCVSAGLAGANWPDEFVSLREALEVEFPGAVCRVYNDCVIALRGGSGAPNAVALCGGTGLNCAVRSHGEIVRVYNNYVAEPDQGGGALGGRAIMAIVEAEIALRPPTALREAALDFFALPDVTQLLLAYQRKQLKPPAKEFVFELMRIAALGDETALGVVQEFGLSLSRYIASAVKLYGLSGRPLDVVLSGGLFKAELPLLRETIAAQARRIHPQANVIDARYEPVVGAALLGLEQLKADDAAIKQCGESARAHGLLRLGQ